TLKPCLLKPLNLDKIRLNPTKSGLKKIFFSARFLSLRFIVLKLPYLRLSAFIRGSNASEKQKLPNEPISISAQSFYPPTLYRYFSLNQPGKTNPFSCAGLWTLDFGQLYFIVRGSCRKTV